MKRFVVLLMIVGLVAGSVATAEAAKKKKIKKVERVVEGAYDAPSLIAVGTCAQTGAIGCVSMISAANEVYVSAEVTDQTGQPVYVSIQGDANGDNQDDINYGTFCGATDAPIAIDAGVELHFWVGVTPDPGIAGCVPGAATTGTLKATFSNLP
jgi:coenzyme F420-reducing hydrogenase gamma subunit